MGQAQKSGGVKLSNINTFHFHLRVHLHHVKCNLNFQLSQL